MDAGSRNFLLYFRERIIFQVASIAVEFADTLGKFLGCHGVLVEQPAKGSFVQVQAFILTRFRVIGSTTASERFANWSEGPTMVSTAAGQTDGLIHVSKLHPLPGVL